MWKDSWAKFSQFQPHKVSTGTLLQCFDQTALLTINAIKEGCLHYGVYFMMSYMHLSSCIHCFHEYEFEVTWEKLNCSRELIIPMTTVRFNEWK